MNQVLEFLAENYIYVAGGSAVVIVILLIIIAIGNKKGKKVAPEVQSFNDAQALQPQNINEVGPVAPVTEPMLESVPVTEPSAFGAPTVPEVPAAPSVEPEAPMVSVPETPAPSIQLMPEVPAAPVAEPVAPAAPAAQENNGETLEVFGVE